MADVQFLPIGEAAARVGRDPQTIRNWANSGKVRRRQRGRIVEYHEFDLLAAAGLDERDERDREIAQLRVALEQAQRAKLAAEEVATRRKQSNVHLREQAAQKYREKDAEIAKAQATIHELQQRNARGRARVAELEGNLAAAQQQHAQLRSAVHEWQVFHDHAVAICGRYAALVGQLMGVLTKRELREEAEKLLTDGQALGTFGRGLRGRS